MPARRRCFRRCAPTGFSFARYVDDMVAACAQEGRDVPLRRPTSSRAPDLLAPVRPHRDRERRALSLRRSAALATALLDPAPRTGPACAGVFSNPAFPRLVLLPGPARAPATTCAASRARARRSSSSATPPRPARAGPRSPARSRRRSPSPRRCLSLPPPHCLSLPPRTASHSLPEGEGGEGGKPSKQTREAPLTHQLNP